MSSLTLLAVLLASGWWFYRQLKLTRFEALRHPGHPQYFGAALCAAYLFAVGSASHYLATQWQPYTTFVSGLMDHLPQFGGKDDPKPPLLQLACIAGFALGAAWLLPLMFNFPMRLSKRLEQTVARKQLMLDQLEELAIRCEAQGLLCALTLDSGKVYLGVPEMFSWHGTGRDWLSLMPVASGYRTTEGMLDLTTFYASYRAAAKQQGTARGAQAFRVVIATTQVQHAQSFDLEMFLSAAPAPSPPPSPLILVGVTDLSTSAATTTAVTTAVAATDNELTTEHEESDTAPPSGDMRRYAAYISFLVVTSSALAATIWRPIVALWLLKLGFWLALYAAFYVTTTEADEEADEGESSPSLLRDDLFYLFGLLMLLCRRLMQQLQKRISRWRKKIGLKLLRRWRGLVSRPG